MEEEIREILRIVREENYSTEIANKTLQNENRTLRQINEMLLNIINNKVND